MILRSETSGDLSVARPAAAGFVLSAGRHAGTVSAPRLRRVFSPHATRSSFACSTLGPAPDRPLRVARNAPTRCGTATCPTPARGLVYGFRAYGPVRAAGGASLQSAQAAARSICASPRRRDAQLPMCSTAIASTRRAPTCRSIGATARLAC